MIMRFGKLLDTLATGLGLFSQGTGTLNINSHDYLRLDLRTYLPPGLKRPALPMLMAIATACFSGLPSCLNTLIFWDTRLFLEAINFHHLI